MRNSSLLAIEIIWIATGILCIAAGVKSAFTNGGSRIPVFAVMALICFVFAWLRERQRKKS
jgi:hypothetical protein